MRRAAKRWVAMWIVCATTSGCLLNSVHQITRAPRYKPDSTHAIVVIGVGLETAGPNTQFEFNFAEYSIRKGSITGSCFHYNRIAIKRSSSPVKTTYLAFA